MNAYPTLSPSLFAAHWTLLQLITNNTSINLNKTKHPLSVKHFLSGIESTNNPPNELLAEEFSRKEIPAEKQKLIESFREIPLNDYEQRFEKNDRTPVKYFQNTPESSFKYGSPEHETVSPKVVKVNLDLLRSSRKQKAIDSSRKKAEIYDQKNQDIDKPPLRINISLSSISSDESSDFERRREQKKLIGQIEMDIKALILKIRDGG